jgi:hypothetical protein
MIRLWSSCTTQTQYAKGSNVNVQSLRDKEKPEHQNRADLLEYKKKSITNLFFLQALGRLLERGHRKGPIP